MQLPTIYHDDFLNYEGRNNPDGTRARPRVYSLVFPPIGFFPFYDIGNGDYHGFYWPIGKEEEPPLVAFSSHDVYGLIPEHASIETFYACELARGGDDTDMHSLASYRELVEMTTGRQPADPGVREIAHDDYDQLLKLDEKSPYYLCAAGDVRVTRNEVEEAEEKYREALKYLPEYVAAHFGLAYVLRRQRRLEEATVHLRKSLIGPLVFYGGSFWGDSALPGSFRNDWSRKALLWLQSAKVLHESLVHDPFARRIKELKLETGLAVNNDIEVLRQIVDDYATSGAYSEAARIWNLRGDLAAMETTSFRERYHLNPRTYGSQLADLFELSGYTLRATLVWNMLESMEKPEGLYL